MKFQNSEKHPTVPVPGFDVHTCSVHRCGGLTGDPQSLESFLRAPYA